MYITLSINNHHNKLTSFISAFFTIRNDQISNSAEDKNDSPPTKIDKATQTLNDNDWSLIETEPGKWVSKQGGVTNVSNSFDTNSTKDLDSEDEDDYKHGNYDDMGKDDY